MGNDKITATSEINDEWYKLRDIIKEAATEVCGRIDTGTTRKQTHWWNEEIKMNVMEKKRLWKIYNAENTIRTFEIYKQPRKQQRERRREKNGTTLAD